MRILVPALALILLGPVAFAGQVLVVGPNPGQLHSLQDAVTLSNDGDVILVKSGTYSSIRITNRSAVIVEDNGANAVVSGAIRVRQTSVMQPVVLIGLSVTGVPSNSLPELTSGLFAENTHGPLIAEDCVFQGANSVSVPCNPYTPRGGADLYACLGVTFVRCSMIGNIGSWSVLVPSPQGPGLRGRAGSTIALDDSVATGGYGGVTCSGYSDGSSGGNGCELTQSSLFALGSQIRGANGTPLTSYPPLVLGSVAGSGGSGAVQVAPGTSTLRLFNSTLAYGLGINCGGVGLCSDGEDGAPAVGFTSGNVTTITSPSPVLSGPRIVRDNQLATFQIQAQLGERVELAVARAPDFVDDPAVQGIVHLRDPVWQTVGLIQQAGIPLTRSYTMPDVPVLDPGRVFFVQARVTSPGGGRRLTSVQAVVLVDASY